MKFNETKSGKTQTKRAELSKLQLRRQLNQRRAHTFFGQVQERSARHKFDTEINFLGT